MTCIYTRHIYLDNAAKAALCAHYTDGISHESRINDARDNLIAALSGCEAGATRQAEEMLLDLIANAISDSFDVDWKPEYGARSVLDALLNEVAPLPADDEVAV